MQNPVESRDMAHFRGLTRARLVEEQPNEYHPSSRDSVPRDRTRPRLGLAQGVGFERCLDLRLCGAYASRVLVTGRTCGESILQLRASTGYCTAPPRPHLRPVFLHERF